MPDLSLVYLMSEVVFFNSETKVRELVSQLVEPVIRRSAEDRALVEQLKKQTDADGKRLEELEFSQAKTVRKLTLIEEMNRKVQDLNARLGLSEANLTALVGTLENQVNKTRLEHNKHDAVCKSLVTKTQSLEGEFMRFEEMISKYQKTVLAEYKSVASQIASGLAEVKELSGKMEISVQKVAADVLHNTGIFPKHQVQIEMLERQHSDLSRTLTQLQLHKVSDDQLRSTDSQLTSQLHNLTRLISEVESKRSDLELFIESHLPVLTQFLISNSLTASGDKRLLRKYFSFETTALETMYKEMRDKTKSSGLENLKKVTMMRANEMEARKSEYAQLSEDMSPTSVLSESPRVRHNFALRVQPVQGLPNIQGPEPDRAFLTSTEAIHVDEESAILSPNRESRFSQALKERETAILEETGSLSPHGSQIIVGQGIDDEDWMESTLKDVTVRVLPLLQTQCAQALKMSVTNQETHEQLTTLLRSELDALSKREKRNFTDLKSDISAVTTRLSVQEDARKGLDHNFGRLNDLTSAMIDVLTAIQKLLAQDELDREQIQLTGYKEQVKGQVSRPVLSMQPECLSCSGQAQTYLTAFKMACLNYAPSMVKYKENTLPRSQLISLLGDMLESACDKTSWRPAFCRTDKSVETRPVLDEDVSRRKKLPDLLLPSRAKLELGTTPKSTRRRSKKPSFDLSYM